MHYWRVTEVGRTTNSDRVLFFHYTDSASFIRSSWFQLRWGRCSINFRTFLSRRWLWCTSWCCFSCEQDDLTVISPSTNETCFHLICLPKFDLDPTRTEIWTLHTFPWYLALSSYHEMSASNKPCHPPRANCEATLQQIHSWTQPRRTSSLWTLQQWQHNINRLVTSHWQQHALTMIYHIVLSCCRQQRSAVK